MRILALDLGKHKTVFLDSVVGSDQREYGKVELVRLWAMLRDQAPWKEQAPAREAAPA